MLLTACQEWEKNAHRGVSIQRDMDMITNLLLSWRKLEMTSLKHLLSDHLASVREQTVSKFWLHIIEIVFEKKARKEEVVRSLVRFMEAGSIGDFQARLDILSSVIKFLKITGNESPILSVLVNLSTYFSQLNLGVETELRRKSGEAENKLKDLLKFAKWKDTNFWSVKSIMDKTKKALHKTLREYQKSISVPCKDFFKETQSEKPEEEIIEEKIVDAPKRNYSLTSSNLSVTSNSGKLIGELKPYFID